MYQQWVEWVEDYCFRELLHKQSRIDRYLCRLVQSSTGWDYCKVRK